MNVELLVSTCTNPAKSVEQRQENRDRLASYLKAGVGNAEAEALADALLAQLQIPDAQTRGNALDLVDEFFLRSRIFRRVAVTRLERLVNGCMRDVLMESSLSAEAAENLRHRMVHALATWKQRFGHLYPEILMACHHVEQNLKHSLPDSSTPYVSLSEIRSRERRREAYRQALSRKNELLEECERVRTEVSHALDLHDQCSVEWDDLPVSAKQKRFLRQERATAKESADKKGLRGKHRLLDVPPKEVDCMDPAVEESLTESIESMRKRLIPRLRSLISAALHAHVESLSDPELQQRNAVMRRAIDLRNALQDQRNDILRLGIAPRRRMVARTSSATQRAKENEMESVKCRRREEGLSRDDTLSVNETLCRMETGNDRAAKRQGDTEVETGVSSSKKDEGCSSLIAPLRKKRRQNRETVQEDVLRRLLKTAPRLSEAEAKEVMRSGRWQRRQ